MYIVIYHVSAHTSSFCVTSSCTPAHSVKLSVDANTSESLASVLWLSGKIPPAALCSGIGLCGRCKVRFLSCAPQYKKKEERYFTKQELTSGWRLACCHSVMELGFGTRHKNNDMSVELELPSIPQHSPTQKKTHSKTSVRYPLRMAVDLGTTSLCWQVFACAKHGRELVAQGQCLNPQMGAGADVISRLAAAVHGEKGAQLTALVRDTLGDILCQEPLRALHIEEICLAANTAMTGIFLGKDVRCLAHAPYGMPMQGHSVEHVQDLPPMYIPPQLAPFVGGDVTAGMWALMQEQPTYPFLLADLGTNGEFVLALDAKTAFVTSVPMGPAIEGIGLRFGALAGGQGVVHTVRLGPQGLRAQSFHDTAPQALCGTGYISLIHCLLRVGVIQSNGGFYTQGAAQHPLLPLGRKLMTSLHDTDGHEGRRLYLWPSTSDIFLSAFDVEEVLKVKAAFSLAIQALLAAAHLTHADVAHMYVAGAMGSHVHMDDLEGLGFVPMGMGKRIKAVGNSALAGACLLACQEDARQSLHAWTKGCRHVELAQDTNFDEKFLRHMSFLYTE